MEYLISITALMTTRIRSGQTFTVRILFYCVLLCTSCPLYILKDIFKVPPTFAPFTDGVGNRYGYADSVEPWIDYHDTLLYRDWDSFVRTASGNILK